MEATTDLAAVEYSSALAFGPTLDLLISAIENAGMTVFARIDHAAGATEAGMTMPPAVVLIYGNPKGWHSDHARITVGRPRSAAAGVGP